HPVVAAVPAVEPDNGRQRRVTILEAWLESGIVLSLSRDGSQMGTRRATGHHQRAGVGTVLVAMLVGPCDHPFGVCQVVEVRRFRPQPVVGADGHPALGSEAVE